MRDPSSLSNCPRTPRKRKWARLGILLLCIALPVAAGELLVRYTFLPLSTLHEAGRVVDDERGYAFRPSVSVQFRGIHERLPESIVWRSNPSGYRSLHGDAIQPRSSKFRIGTFGDSETFGWSVAYEQSFQHLLESSDSTIEVLNFGIPGYNIDNIAATVERVVDSMDLDLALVMINPNDMDPPLKFTDLLIDSELIRRIIFTYLTLTEESVIESRSDSEAVHRLRNGLRRIDKKFTSRNIAWVAVKWNSTIVESVLDSLPASPLLTEVIDASPVFSADTKIDFHLSPDGHRRLARDILRRLPKWKQPNRQTDSRQREWNRKAPEYQQN